MCQRLKRRWTVNAQVASAMVAAMGVAAQHKQMCPTKQSNLDLKVAKYKLQAIAKACPDPMISTDRPSEVSRTPTLKLELHLIVMCQQRMIRVTIRREIASEMVKAVDLDPVLHNTFASKEAHTSFNKLFDIV